ncbi:hypothetical protein [Flammeovirga aprica]|uniref:Uncharacterized protein n=1 Tax=Flammeovirga aprica JL-4 TaxID=694437 RepID=A0A7X9S0C3_9BACT|nr:hypothetical protein [Flammeovirga aprica]NME72023.1 hypothetical protein [Flammeovirga aprica JL-4]
MHLKKIFIFILFISCTDHGEREIDYDQVEFLPFEHQELIPTLVVDSLDKTIDLYNLIWTVMKKYDHIAPNDYLRIHYNDSIYYTNNYANFCFSTSICCPKTSQFYKIINWTPNTLDEILFHFNSVDKEKQHRKIIEISFDKNTNLDSTLQLLKTLEKEFSSGRLKGYPYTAELIPSWINSYKHDNNNSSYELIYDSIGTRSYILNTP